MKGKLGHTVLLAVLIFSAASYVYGQGDKPNILFIAVDDMNCDFGAYGNPEVRSPNLDDLAASGVLFNNNHCQQAVCGASRASVLSGFTPEHTGITGFNIYLRDLYPDVVTIPQFFKNEGYTTVGMGKIHDPRNVSLNDNVDMVSWSNFIDISGSRWLVSSGSPVTEMADLPDESYVDGMLATNAVQQIQNLAGGEDPFFLAVGFKKPHLPFVAPKKYWDLYDRDSISLAPFRQWAENDEEFVHNPGAEFFNSYDNVPEMGTWSFDLQREYIHGYYACVSFIDAQVGKLISELKTQGIYDNTIIVLWGDHGFSLGDHTNWGKHTNFEYATRSPLIIKAPGHPEGIVCNSPSEHLDIYPTLVDLAGYTVPDTLDGNSLLPIVSGEKEEVKSFAVSQFRRGGKQGFVLRTKYYQYVEWTKSSTIEHQQLFNFALDPYQTVNLSADPYYTEIIDTFSFNLNRYLDSGINTKPINLTNDSDSLNLHSKFQRLSFSVLGNNGKQSRLLDDATIQIDNFQLPTSNKGYSGLNLQAGSYAYSIQKEDYWTSNGVFNLSRDTLIIDTLQKRYFNLEIIVRDSISQAPINGLEIDFGGATYITNPQGTVEIKIEGGDYAVSIQADEYTNFNDQVTILSDSTLLINLRSEFAFIKFKVYDSGVPVLNALVDLDGESMYTNAIGIANFVDQKVDSVYVYQVSKEGYRVLDGSFVLRGDTTIELSMEELTFTAEITVSDTLSLEPVSEAMVQLDDAVMYTNALGKVIFMNLGEASYDLTVVKDGYLEKNIAVHIDKDTSMQISIARTTGLDNMNRRETTIFPNPAREFIHINSVSEIDYISMYSLSGKVMDKDIGPASDVWLDINGLAPGVYILSLHLVEGAMHRHKLFILE